MPLRISVLLPDRQRADVVSLIPLAVGGGRVRHPAGDTVRSLDQDCRVLGGHGVGRLHHRVDGGLGHLARKVPLPVILEPEWDLREEMLDLDVADRPDSVDQRRSNFLEWADEGGALFGRPVVARSHQGDLAHLGQDHDRVGAAQLVGSRRGHVAEGVQGLAPILDRPDDHAAQQLTHRMNLKLERGHDPEIAAATAYRPIQVLVLDRARFREASIGQHHVNR